MKILLTGCAGFIGARVAEMLLENKDLVVGIDNLNTYYDIKIKISRLKNLKKFKENFIFFKGNIEDKKFLKGLFQNYNFDIIYNIAARAGVPASIASPEIYFTTNVLGTLNLLECARFYNIRKFVLTSTSSLYANQPMPFIETLPVNEPISPYATSKKAAETLCYTYHHLYGIDISVLRCFTVYGPNGRPDMSPDKFMRCIASEQPVILNGDGTQSRDFTFIDDIARGIILAQKPLGYEIINLGSHQPHTINEMISFLEQLLRKKAYIKRNPFNNFDMMHTFADISKARRLLNWEPKFSLQEGLGKMVEKTTRFFS